MHVPVDINPTRKAQALISRRPDTGPDKTVDVDQNGAINVMDQAKAAGVKRFLIVSSMRAEEPEAGPEKNGLAFYEQQETGVGEHFLGVMQADIAALVVHAGVYRRCFGHSHRKLSQRFPFAIYYRIEHNEIWVDAVLDSRRDPSLVNTRLS